MSRSEADVRNALTRAITDAAISVVSQMAGSTWDSIETAAIEEPVTRVGICFEVEPQVTFAIEVPYSDSLRIAGLFLGAPAQPSEDKQLTDEQTEILHEFVRQVLGLAVSQLRPEFGQLTPSIVPGTPVAESVEVAWTVISDRSAALRLGVAIDSADSQNLLSLAAKIESAKPASAVEAPEIATETAPMESAQQVAAANPAVAKYLQERNFDLLLDIELQVSLRFGRREMLLKDILELSSGSVVELDRLIQEPVDLLLDHKVIARGEVVVVEGNYGLRVTEVATPRQRIECLC